MSLDATHPNYVNFKEDWSTMRDFYKGERVVKDRGPTYLPPTAGMQLDGMGSSTAGKVNVGQAVYDSYKARAVFPDYVKEAVEAYIGLLHQKPPTIELPPQMEDMRDRATLHGESLEMLLRRINEEQLVTGRVGLMLDLPVSPDPANPMPYVALYIAESIPNWDDDEIGEGVAQLNLVVLNESGYKRDANFDWNLFSKYRVLMLVRPTVVDADGNLVLDAQGEPAQGVVTYMQGVFTNEGGGAPIFVGSDMAAPLIRGSEFEEIPFVFANAKDIISSPDEPPLMGLARLCRAIYCGEADFRQNLFMQGQDTFVTIGDRKKRAGEVPGEEEAVRTGAGSMVEMETGGDAKYVGVESSGLTEQRATLEADRNRAEARSGQLISAKANGVESGDALKTRVAAQTATLNQLALTGAAALESLLKKGARWMGADPEKVKVTPNLEFSDFDMTGENLVKLMTARAMGAPISKRSVHDLISSQGLTKMDYDTELDTIAEEDANDPRLTGTLEGGNPDDPNDPANQDPKDPKDQKKPAPKKAPVDE